MTIKNSILVTGGAGYIGSHIVRQLGEHNERIIVLDNLSTGHANDVLAGELIIGNCGDETLITQLIHDKQIDSVIHLAAHTIVPESVRDPLKYYTNNTLNTCKLLQSCVQNGIKNFIFSSSAAVYGIPNQPFVSEEGPCAPINPYGRSKLMSEWMLQDVANASDLRYIALRYFNVGGADPKTRIGQRNVAATTLIKVATQAAVGLRDQIEIFGTDYNTPDGTGIRDYIHVEDLASAHLQALAYLRQGNSSLTLNCGYGHGYSVREVLNAVERLAQTKLPIHEVARRAGDPAMVIADAKKIQQLLDWQPRFANLDAIITSALAWERKLKG